MEKDKLFLAVQRGSILLFLVTFLVFLIFLTLELMPESEKPEILKKNRNSGYYNLNLNNPIEKLLDDYLGEERIPRTKVRVIDAYNKGRQRNIRVVFDETSLILANYFLHREFRKLGAGILRVEEKKNINRKEIRLIMDVELSGITYKLELIKKLS